MSIVTLFSGSHCHGEEVAKTVAERLELEPLGEKLLGDASRRFDIPRQKIERAITGPPSFWNNYTHEREKNIACLKVVLAELIAKDNKLLYGGAGHLIPKDISHVLHVCIIANFPYRVQQAVKTTGKPRKEVLKLLRKQDQERLRWTQFLFDKPPYDESLYDLVVPMQDKSVQEAADLISETAQSDSLKMTAASQFAVGDFQLASQVNLVLAEAKHNVDVSAVHGEVTVLIKHHVMRMKQQQGELKRLALTTPGVMRVKVRIGPKYQAPAINPMANVELPPKILLVDDEKEFVQTLSERLRTRQLPTSVVYNGRQALDYVEKDQPDVMVLDLMMPGIDGIEVLRRIKQTHPNVEVIILSGHGSEREEQMAANLGAFAFLRKPVNIEILAQVMRAAYQKGNEANRAVKELDRLVTTG